MVYVSGSHGYGVWMGAGMELVLGKHAGQSQGVCRKMPEYISSVKL